MVPPIFTSQPSTDSCQILYGLPAGIDKVGDLSDLWDTISSDGAVVRLLLDHPDQVRFLEEYEAKRSSPRVWSAFIKIDGGQKFVDDLLRNFFSLTRQQTCGCFD